MWTAEHRERYKDDARRYPSDLTDAEWETIRPFFAAYRTLTVDLREMVNACLYLQKTGCGWRYLPTDFGAWETDGQDLARPLQGGRPLGQRRCAVDPGGASGPRAGERGVDGKKMVKGIKRHVLTCSLGFVLAVVVTAAKVHDTAAGPLLDKATAAGWLPKRVNVDGIYTGERMDAAAGRHGLDVQLSSKPAEVAGFMPLPLRWRIERTFGMHTNGYRRLTRNLEQDTTAAENAVEMANFHRVLKAYGRQIDGKA